MPAALSKHMTFEQDGADWSEGHDAAKEPHPGLLTKPLPCGLSAAELCCFCFQVLRAHLESLPLPRFPADPGFKAPLFVTWLKPRQSGTNATSTSQLELRGCIGCLEPIHFHSGLTEYAIRSSMKDRRFPPVRLDEVPSLTCRISILHQFEPCAHAFDWQVGVHGVLLNFSDSQGRRFSATYLPEVAKEHGMTREVAIRELVAKSGYAGPCQEILDFLEVTRYQTIVESVSYQDLASYGFGGLPHLNSP
ncbi:unnamed protein product [Durusdinium trenchii]|uniref:AMMECR1 domain-containing protein n=1 Tax=Durusdinium trenchii TaxID=1381693 RepID=A0ABP0IP08_9DINO